MHPSSYARMAEFAKRLKPGDKVLDVGSMDVNGTFRPIFEQMGCEYTGLDIVEGPNVDVVVDSMVWVGASINANAVPFDVDAVVCGSTLEHVSRPWVMMENIRRFLKPGGLACIIAPSQGPIHEHPIDCWRILPAGMRALGEWAGLEEVAIGLDETDHLWRDCWGIFRKGEA